MSRVYPLAIVLTLLAGCAEVTKREAVYIPTKCKTKPISKPKPSKESSISEQVAEIFAYTDFKKADSRVKTFIDCHATASQCLAMTEKNRF